MKTLANPDDLKEIIGRIRRLSPQSVRQWGKMSPGEMVCHLIDVFHVALGEKKVAPVSMPLGHSVMKWFVLYAPVHWPKNVPTGKPTDPQAGGMKPGDFSADVDELERTCHRFVLSKKQNARLEHPFFGALSDREWLRWAYLHQDHHLRQFGL